LSKIKLIIADNHIIFREGLVKLFESENDFDIISNANNAKECFDVLCNECPDLLILDLNLPHHDSIEIIRKLKLGEIDAVIGTHRLLSKDVEFKDLGFLIIDE